MKYFTRNHRQELLKNKWYTIYLDDVTTPTGHHLPEYYVINCPHDAVATLILNERKEILFVNVYRYLLDALSLEIPCGSIEFSETPLVAAKRECLEETGYTVNLKDMPYRYYPSNGISTQVVQVFFGQVDTNIAQKKFDTDEVKTVVWLTTDQVKAAIAKNLITDGITLTALLLYLQAYEG